MYLVTTMPIVGARVPRWFVDKFISESTFVLSVASFIGPRLPGWIFKILIWFAKRNWMGRPKLHFTLEENPDENGWPTPYNESKYCIYCHNDDKDSFLLGKIVIETTKRDREPDCIIKSGFVNEEIKRCKPYIRKLTERELEKINEYIEEKDKWKCNLWVFQSDSKKYTYKLDLTKIKEWNALERKKPCLPPENVKLKVPKS